MLLPEMEGALAAYSARFTAMWHQCGPGSWRYLLATRAELEGARASGAAPRLLAARLHPDTLAPIPLPLCMAAHVPCNALLLLAMLSARSPAATAGAQAANQAFNAAQFYANRNASNATPPGVLAASLGGATLSAVGVAAGLAAACGARPHWRGGALQLAVPFLGAAAAKPLQIGLLRADEWREGVEVRDAAGRVRGRSRAAGRWGVAATVATRVLYLVPMLWMPYAQAALERAVPALARHRALGAAADLVHAAATSAIVTPACVALFEQRQGVAVGDLEEEFHALAGEGVSHLYFNKGV